MRGTRPFVGLLSALFLGLSALAQTLILRAPIANAPVGDLPPEWVTPAGSLGAFSRGEAASIPLAATDPEGRAVTVVLAAGTLPDGLSLSADPPRIAGTVAVTAPRGTASFTLVAEDAAGNRTPRQFSLTVGEASPVWVTAPDTLLATIVAGTSLPAPVSALASDVDGDIVGYALAPTSPALPPNLTLNATTGAISGLVAATTPAGRTDIELRVSDAGGRVADRRFGILVVANGAPVWQTPTALSSLHHELIPSFSFVATDPEGGPVTYELTGGSIPIGTSIADGILSGRATFNTAFSFTLAARDAENNRTDRSFTWTVNRQPSCSALKTANPTLSGYQTVDVDFGVGVNAVVTCDMSNDGGGWTLALVAKGNSTLWGNNASQWRTPLSVSDFGVSVSGNFPDNDYTGRAYTTLVHNTARLCLVNGTRCVNLPHSMNRTLQSFFVDNVSYTLHSRNQFAIADVNAATNVNTYVAAWGPGNWALTTYGAPYSCTWVGINQRVDPNLADSRLPGATTTTKRAEIRASWTRHNTYIVAAIGLIGDVNAGCNEWWAANVNVPLDRTITNDDYALGVGIQSCFDANGCAPGAENSSTYNSTTYTIQNNGWSDHVAGNTRGIVTPGGVLIASPGSPTNPPVGQNYAPSQQPQVGPWAVFLK